MSETEPQLLPEEASLECRICWWVYDPAEGDELGQIPPGIPFANLPQDWRCPQCDSAPEGFLAVSR